MEVEPMLSKSQISIKHRRDDFLRKARTEIVKGAMADFSARELAVRTGFTPAFVSRRVGDRERVYRLVMLNWLSELAEFAPQFDTNFDRPSAAVDDAATKLSQFFARPAYREFLSVIMRSQSNATWLSQRHRKAILEPLEYGIYNTIRRSGEAMGLSLEVRSQAIAAFVDRIETAYALEPLKPRICGWQEQGAVLASQQSAKILVGNIYETEKLLHAA